MSRRWLRYKALKHDEGRKPIRLLSLLPGEKDEPIRTSLRYADLNNPPKYEALSYCWEQEESTLVSESLKSGSPRSIHVGKDVLNVTSNLYQALLHLRLRDKGKLFWIDAICINQRDNGERSKQVAMMREIYEYAHLVVIWLGVASDQSRLAFATMRRIVNTSLKTIIPLTTPINRDEAFAMMSIYKRPYFSRIWVIQEAAVARKGLIVCGDQQIGLQAFLVANMEAAVTRGEFGGIKRENWKLNQDLWLERLNRLEHARYILDGDATVDLLPLVLKNGNFHSSDPRDKIYGLLGLAPESAADLDIKPDYTIDTNALYTKFAESVTRLHGDLRILEATSEPLNRRSGIPSWCPDWSNPIASVRSMVVWETRQEALGVYSRFLMRRSQVCLATTIDEIEDIDVGLPGSLIELGISVWDIFKKPQSKDFQASPVAKDNNIIIDNGGMTVSGYVFDRISTLGSAIEGIDRDAELEKISKWSSKIRRLHHLFSLQTKVLSTCVEWDDIALRPGEFAKYPNGQLRKDAYRQTMFGGFSKAGPEKDEDLFRIYRFWLMVLRMLLRVAFVVPGFVISFVFGSLFIMSPGLTKLGEASFFDSIIDFTQQRRIVETTNGYLGLVPRGTEKGDVVALLKGARVPFVLRSSGNNWELVGCCYVHGIMHGEAFEDKQCRRMTIH